MKEKSKWREYGESIVIAIILALIIRSSVVQAFKIPSGSMIPTLLIGDHILVNKFIYGVKFPFTDKKIFSWKNPERGDVIVFIYPVDKEKDFIKRVIGVEGDKIEIKGKKIFINSRPYDDPSGYYCEENKDRNKENFGPIVVPEGSLFMMGDNRDRSYDSRFWGFVNLDQVKGKAFIIYWSNGSAICRNKYNVPAKVFDSAIYNRWNRMGKLIH